MAPLASPRVGNRDLCAAPRLRWRSCRRAPARNRSIKARSRSSTQPRRRKVRSSSGARSGARWNGFRRPSEKSFPGIDVQFLGDNDIAVKAIAEARAGRHQVDVYQSSLTGTLPVVQRDLLANVDWSAFGIDNRNIAFDGKMAYTSNIVYTVAYNNKLAKDADAPKNWIGHSRRALQGKGRVQHVSAAATDRRAWAWPGARTRRCSSRATSSPRRTFCSRGRRANRCCNRASASTRSGKSIRSFVPWPPRAFRSARWCREPVVVGQFGVTIMKNAPHPNAARLLAGFLASAEGKAARLQTTSQADYGPTSDNELAKAAAFRQAAGGVGQARQHGRARGAVRPRRRHLDRTIALNWPWRDRNGAIRRTASS